MTMEKFFKIGIIASTHGLKGEVKVYPTTSDIRRYDDLVDVIIDIGDEHLLLEIQQVKYFKKMVILKFKGIDHINDVEKYKGKDLLVPRENAVKLEEDEYFIADLLGMKIVSDDGRVGTLIDVIESSANDVYVVKFDEIGEVLIPAIKDCILNVDIKGRVMNVHLIDGLVL
jgi:16S rRNA processing protein RimM